MKSRVSVTLHDSRYIYVWVNSMIYMSRGEPTSAAIVKGGAGLLASVPVGEL